jgi:hypothetical protein
MDDLAMSLRARVRYMTGPLQGLLQMTNLDDGTLRVYHQSGSRVLKAISGLVLEISSIVASTTNDGNMGTVWLACGRQVSAIPLSVTPESPLSADFLFRHGLS